MDRAITAEHLLSEASWLRRLAGRLADDRDDADDLAQEAWIAAWRRQPDPDRPLRPWLAKVVRDAARMRRRTDARRAAREATVADDAAVATPDDLLAQARLHQTLVELVLALDEPYRATVLARYVEGRSAADIARAAGVPEGTVRWRLSQALHRLRDQLDARARKRAWLPFAAAGGGHALRATTTKTVVGAVIALALLLALFRFGPGSSGGAGRGFRPPPIDAPITPFAGADSKHASGNATPSGPPWLTPADAATHPIAGRVVDEHGAPIAGALVQLQSWPIGNEENRSITAADGTFHFAPRYAAAYYVAASASRRAPTSMYIDSRASSDGYEPSELVLILGDCAQTAEGMITDAGGGPIAGATILRLTTGRPGPFGVAVTSAADGSYAICLPRGTSWLNVGADGYEHVLRELAAHDGRLHVDIALAPGASVGGQVIDAATGAPIAGVWVGLWPIVRRSGEGADRHALTDENGRFTIDALALGRYSLTAQDDSHVKASIDELTVSSVNGTTLAPIRMDRGETIRGVVRSGETPVANARVGLTVPGLNYGGLLPTPMSVVTAADGTFILHGVPRAPSLTPTVATYAVRSPTTIDTTSPPANLVLEVDALSTLRGRVVRAGVGVADAAVTARGTEGGDKGWRTAVDGTFAIPGVAPGAYQVSAMSDSLGAYSTRAASVTVPSNADVIIELDAGGTMTGTVRDEAGAAVVGAEVIAKDEHSDDYGASITAVDGSFAISTLAGGDYRVHVRPYASAPHDFAWAGTAPAVLSVPNGSTHVGPITLTVKRSVRPIAGIVIDETGAPVSDAIVRLGPVWGWTSTVPIARTTTDGRFRLTAVGDGPFSLDAGTGGGPLASLTDVAPGTEDVVLRLVRPGSIAGTVVGLAGARVWLWRAGGILGAASVPEGQRTVMTRDDRFVFAGLVPGDYGLLAVSATDTASAAVHIEPGLSASVTMAAGPTRRVTGTVSIVGGGRVVGATCIAAPSLGELLPPGMNRSLPQQAVTAADGTFAIERAPAGDALVLCVPARRYTSGAVVVPAAADHATVEIAPGHEAELAEPGFAFVDNLVPPIVADVYGDDAVHAGIAPGDRVVAIDGMNVESLYVTTVALLIESRPSGSTVTLTFDRDGARFDAPIVMTQPVPHAY